MTKNACICNCLNWNAKNIILLRIKINKSPFLLFFSAEEQPITSEYFNGTLVFTWTRNPKFLLIEKDNNRESWIRFNETKYVVNDFLLWNSIEITVRLTNDDKDYIKRIYKGKVICI